MKRIYAFKNELCGESTSGGAVPTIEELCRKKDDHLVVYGVCFDKDMNARYQRAETFLEAQLFRGSKYVKATIDDSYKSVANDLQNNMGVLFVGIPCQVYGLLQYLIKRKINTEGLVTIDLICHGAPSARLWSKYILLLEEKHKSRVVEYDFRLKQAHGPDIHQAVLKNSNVITNTREMKAYSYLFEQNLCIEKGCFNCPFRNKELERPGDITVGDFWGAEYIIRQFKGKNHISLIMPNSNKGISIVESLNKMDSDAELFLCESGDWRLYNTHLTEQNKMPTNYKMFWEDMNKRDFSYILKKYGTPTVEYKSKRLLINIINLVGAKHFIKKHLNKI